MDGIKARLGRINGVFSEALDLHEPFIHLAARFAHLPGTTVLMSGGDLDCARHHILGVYPWLTLFGRGRSLSLQAAETELDLKADPFDVLREILSAFRPASAERYPLPLCAGLLGYLSYDLKDVLERLPRTSLDDLSLPHLYFTAPGILVIQDKIQKDTRIYIPRVTGNGFPGEEALLKKFYLALDAPAPVLSPFAGDPSGFKSNFTRPLYMDAIRRIREYIAAGDVYQVNMSQRFQMGFSGDPFHLFQTLYKENPAPFFAFIQAGDHQIVSTSPERFLLQEEDHVETRPIKGTRPRGDTPETDAANADELCRSRKDDAELSMIVDLLRNDIGKVCKAGSVQVAEHKRLEAYRNVYHLVSRVVGILDRDKSGVDLIRAAFPGGSITGCPKIRSMEIIDELETRRRHLYTGSIGYISFHDTMDLSIAIRTAVVTGGQILFSVGGGIVYDSDPADEYEETLHKGKTLMAVFTGENRPKAKAKKEWVWMNGGLTAKEEAAVPISHPGFQYGQGFFETIRVVSGNPRFLDEHIARFNRAWGRLLSGEIPDLSWAEIIRQVLDKNGLADQTAAVKVLAAGGDRIHSPLNHSLMVTARPYTHRLKGRTENGLRLLTYPHPRSTPLADHKTLNYLYYLQAGKWARKNGGDEALILNPDGTVSETNTANLILICGHSAEIPESDHVLPGIMQTVVVQWLSRNGYSIRRRPISPESLFSADQVLLTNSLMGGVPALRLDDRTLARPSDLWKRINEEMN
jgi:para-aminobenzoate synthetase component I